MATVLAVQTRFGSLSAQPTSTSGPALDEIRSDDIAAHLRFLSDDLLEGRAPSTRGGQLAAKYLASQLALLGFEPAGDNGSYFQDVAIVESVVKPSFTLAAGIGPRFTYLKDVVAFSDIQEPQVEASGEVVFVGHGIVAPEYRWNDYAGVDMAGEDRPRDGQRSTRYRRGAGTIRRPRAHVLRAVDIQVRGSGSAGSCGRHSDPHG